MKKGPGSVYKWISPWSFVTKISHNGHNSKKQLSSVTSRSLLTFTEYLSSSIVFLWSSFYSTFSFLCSVFQIIVCLLDHFIFGHCIVLSLVDIWFLITPLLSSICVLHCRWMRILVVFLLYNWTINGIYR